MTKPEAAQCVAILVAAYPSKVESTEEIISVWQMMFAEQPYQAVSTAIAMHVKTSTDKWPPAIGEINALLTKPDYPTALEAWEEVRTKIRGIGWYGSPTFSCQIITLAVNSFGWQTLCDMENPDVTRSNFIKLYNAQCQRGASRTALGGSDRREIENGSTGLELVGDIEREKA